MVARQEMQISPDVTEALAQKERARGMFFSQAPLSDKQIDQLVYYSTDSAYPGHEAIARNTSDPDRFRDKEAVEKWLQKGRFYMTLTNEADDLLGICWLGPEKMPTEGKTFTNRFDPKDAEQYNVTYAIRTYGAANGAGVSTLLTAATREAYQQTDEYKQLQDQNKHHTWLEVGAGNKAAIGSYTKSGCIPATEPYRVGDNGAESLKITMVFTDTQLEPPQHTIYQAPQK